MKPFKRILRPLELSSDKVGHLHLVDDRYCSERSQLVHAYHIIESDFKKIFDFVELNDSNKNTFSHRIYELILKFLQLLKKQTEVLGIHFFCVLLKK